MIDTEKLEHAVAEKPKRGVISRTTSRADEELSRRLEQLAAYFAEQDRLDLEIPEDGRRLELKRERYRIVERLIKAEGRAIAALPTAKERVR